MVNNKNIIVTGALSGIGKATIEVLLKHNAKVFACIQFETEQYSDYLLKLNKEFPDKIIPIVMDLNDENSIKEAVKKIRSYKISIDGLLNIAGMTEDAIFQMISLEQMKKIMNINFFAQMKFTQYIVKLMLKKGFGSIVNVSSISGVDGNEGQTSYSSSKGAIISATKTLSKELASKGIRVNAIAPGTIATRMTDKVPLEILNKQLSKVNLKRIGQAEEVANLLMFLASDFSSYITGQVIRVDGGM
ncbi:SDR family NAD(P)-dependent oxidoreductase [Candidatus Izemoplasma sp. B36]|uniref:SDR family NAD(P)-dependent oxidoreductase n=1 Tax=Candidatus Izemoplasma sp. B36 TaxID=3242468 RepID=UPI00355637BB